MVNSDLAATFTRFDFYLIIVMVIVIVITVVSVIVMVRSEVCVHLFIR